MRIKSRKYSFLQKLLILLLMYFLPQLYAASNTSTRYLFNQSESIGYSIALKNLYTLEKKSINELVKLYKDPISPDFLSWEKQYIASYVQDFLWHATMRSITLASTPNLYKYLSDAFVKSPVMPYVYTKDGKQLFSGYKGMVSAALFPCFYVDKNAFYKIIYDKNILPERYPQGLMIPFVRTLDGKYTVYNLFKKRFEDVVWRTNMAPTCYVDYQHNSIDEEFNAEELLKNKEYGYVTHFSAMQTIAGETLKPVWVGMHNNNDDIYFSLYKKDAVAEVAWWGNGEYIGPKFEKKNNVVLSDLAVYKLLLLKLGFNNIHEIIQQNDPMFLVHTELATCIDNNSKHAWCKNNLDASKVLEVQIANLLKNNKILLLQARELVDCDIWAIYAEYKKLLIALESKSTCFYADDKGKMSFLKDELMYYLPGEEQMLAYALTSTIKLLWYGTLNMNVFYTETMCAMSAFRHVYLAARYTSWIPQWSFSIFRKAAYHKKIINNKTLAFIDFWQEIVKQLYSLSPEKEHYLMVSGHGHVLSFNKELIALQHDVLAKRRGTSIWGTAIASKTIQAQLRLLDDLQCTIIHSSKADVLQNFDVKKI